MQTYYFNFNEVQLNLNVYCCIVKEIHPFPRDDNRIGLLEVERLKWKPLIVKERSWYVLGWYWEASILYSQCQWLHQRESDTVMMKVNRDHLTRFHSTSKVHCNFLEAHEMSGYFTMVSFISKFVFFWFFSVKGCVFSINAFHTLSLESIQKYEMWTVIGATFL